MEDYFWSVPTQKNKGFQSDSNLRKVLSYWIYGLLTFDPSLVLRLFLGGADFRHPSILTLTGPSRSLQNRILETDVTLTWHEHRLYVVRAHLLPTAKLLFRYSRNGNANAIKLLQLAIESRARRKLYVHVMPMLRRFLKSYSVKTFKEAPDSTFEFERMKLDEFPNFVLIFTDGSSHAKRLRTGAGFHVPSLEYRFGIRLSCFISVLSAEFYFIFCVLKFVLRTNLPLTTIFTDSL